MFAYDSFVPARWFHTGRTKAPRLVVVHCTVSKEMGSGAESVAHYFATATRRGSTHAVADNDSVVGCVRDEDTAFGAAGANSDGLHVELVGLPDQTLAQWLDDFSRAEFAQAARIVGYWSDTYNIPLRWLTVEEVRDGKTRGLTTHAVVEKAFPSTGHWDPGPYFPHGEFLATVTGSFEEDDMFTDADRVELERARADISDCIRRVDTTHSDVNTAIVEVRALGAVVGALAAGQGLDPTALKQAVEDAVKEALREGTG